MVAIVLLAWPAAAATGLLTADQAFDLTARQHKADEVQVRFRIADGYYLYRDKLRFTTEPAAIIAGSPVVPRGKVRDDEFFGKVEILRGEIVIRIPVRVPSGTARFTLHAVSQGCADAGVCYTPQSRHLTLGAGLGEAKPATGADPHRLIDSLQGR